MADQNTVKDQTLDSTTKVPTQVHRRFVNEPMENKPVGAVPGIGVAIGAKLQNMGYPKAENVFGQYLQLDKDKGRFVDWMKDQPRANNHQAEACYKGLDEWKEQHFG